MSHNQLSSAQGADTLLQDSSRDGSALAARIQAWGRELGFQAVAITDTDLSHAEAGLTAWLAAGCHGTMDYMAKHGLTRARPAELVPGTLRVISVRMNYRPPAADAHEALADPGRAYLSRYALGRDYHKLLRNRLQKLADRIGAEIGPFGHRVFTDSAPVLEVALADKSGLGWRGKHTLLLSRDAGSYFFLGELFVALPLPLSRGQVAPATVEPAKNHCGRCRACLDACPTGAIVAPYQLDARRCISYLTIEHRGAIPEDLRPLLGNRIYGCDDCQLVCPWNRRAPLTDEGDFAPRHGLDSASLISLFAWTEAEFKTRMAGSPILRIGHAQWLRNIAVALGNIGQGPQTESARIALSQRLDHPDEWVREHVAWALGRL